MPKYERNWGVNTMVMKFGQSMKYAKETFLSKISSKNETRRLVKGTFLFFKRKNPLLQEMLGNLNIVLLLHIHCITLFQTFRFSMQVELT